MSDCIFVFNTIASTLVTSKTRQHCVANCVATRRTLNFEEKLQSFIVVSSKILMKIREYFPLIFNNTEVYICSMVI